MTGSSLRIETVGTAEEAARLEEASIALESTPRNTLVLLADGMVTDARGVISRARAREMLRIFDGPGQERPS